MPAIAIWIGGMIRWFFKGCKTRLSDEVHARLTPRYLKSYELENYLIGVLISVLITVLVVVFFF